MRSEALDFYFFDFFLGKGRLKKKIGKVKIQAHFFERKALKSLSFWVDYYWIFTG